MYAYGKLTPFQEFTELQRKWKQIQKSKEIESSIDAARRNEDDVVKETAQLKRSVMEFENTMAELERREDRLIWQQMRQDSILKLQSLFELPWADQIHAATTTSTGLPRSLKESRRHEWTLEQRQILTEIDDLTPALRANAREPEILSDEGAQENAEALLVSNIEEETTSVDVLPTEEEEGTYFAGNVSMEQESKTEIRRVIPEPFNEAMPSNEKTLSSDSLSVLLTDKTKSLEWLIQKSSPKKITPLAQSNESFEDPEGRTVTGNLKYLLQSYTSLVDNTLIMELFKDEGLSSIYPKDLRWHIDLLFDSYLMRHGRFIAWTSEAVISHLLPSNGLEIGTELQERICTSATVTMPLESYLPSVAEQPGILQLFSLDETLVGSNCKMPLLFYNVLELVSLKRTIAISFLDFLGIKYCPGGPFSDLLCRPSILNSLSQCFRFLLRLQVLEVRLKDHFMLMLQERLKKGLPLAILLSQKTTWFLGGWRSWTDRSFHETLGVFRRQLDQIASSATLDSREAGLANIEDILSSFSLALEAFCERLGLSDQESRRANEAQFQIVLDLFRLSRNGSDDEVASLGASFDGSLLDTPPPFIYF